MRTVAAGESATISSRVSTSWIRVQVEDSTGAMVDRTSFVKAIEYEQPKADGPIAQATFTFSRKDGTGSTLAPLMTANPPLAEGRTIALAIDAGAGVWKEQYRGRIEDLDWSGRWQNEVVAECSDQSGELRDTFIEEERTYGSDAGVAMETVMQALYTDNAETPPTLHVPVATSAVVTPAFTQSQAGLYEAARALSDAIGWVHWWRNFDASTADWKLTLFEPARTSITSQRTFGVSDYYDVSEMNTSLADIRNAVQVFYRDADGVEQKTAVLEDAASIAKYGRRYMAIIEGEGSPINTDALATTLGNAALSDLKEPTATLEIVAPYFWPGEIGVDRYTFTANGIHFSADQTLAATNIRHSLVVGQRPETRIQTRGQPTGGVNIWKAKSQRPKPGSRPETLLLQNLRARDSADGLSEIIEWTNGAKLEEVWKSTQTFTAPVDSDAWELVAASVEQMSPLLATSLTVAKPATEDLVRLVQIEGRYLDPATGELLVGQVWRRIVYPAPREQPVIEVDDEESDTTGTQWVKIRERGITVTQVRTRTQQGTQPITAWGAPTRSSGGASTVKGGTLGTLEYEQDVPLDSTRFSWIEFELTLETGEIKTLGPFGFDRDKRPNLIDVVVTGQKVKAVGDPADTKSIKAEKTSGAGSAWSEHVDGLNHTFSVPVGSSDTWGVRVTAYSQPKAYVTASTLSDTVDVSVQGATAAAEPVWTTFTVTEPALADDVVTITLKADSAPVGYTARVWKQHIGVDGSFSDITANLTPALSAPPTTQTDYSWSSGVTRTKNDSGAALVEIDIRAEILNGSGVVVETATRRVSYYTGGSLI